MNITAVIRGGGDLGTGVAYHLRRLGVRVIITELDSPKMVRHPVCLGYAVYNEVQRVEHLTARLMSLEEAQESWSKPGGTVWDDIIPVVIDRDGRALETLRPAVVCDCRMLKYEVPDERGLAPVVVGLGPGFCASCRWQGKDTVSIAGNQSDGGAENELEPSALDELDAGYLNELDAGASNEQGDDNANVDCVIETQRGEHLGDIIASGRAIPNTGVPGVIGGESSRRLLRAPQAGSFRGLRHVGELIEAGTVVGFVGELPVVSAIGGRLRGLVHDGLQVRLEEKIGDCDPRGAAVSAFRISDKSHAIGASVASLLQSLPAEVKEQLQLHEEQAHPASCCTGQATVNNLAVDASGADKIKAEETWSAHGQAAPALATDCATTALAPTIVAELRGLGNARQALHQRKFYKTAPGEYGAGDKFLGLTVPQVRTVSKRYHQASLETVAVLLQSEYHEVRLCALQLLVQQFRRDQGVERSALVALYVALSGKINNWDLVDLSVSIVGEWLDKRERSLLFSLAHSDCLWCRRMAIVATHPLIKRGDISDALAIAALLLSDREDLIHKAVGWMLREVGKQDGAALRQFLRTHYANLPRTALRYAIERFPEEERRAWLKGPAEG